MKIAVLGSGAMGLLFGAYLSQNNEVTIVGRNQANMDAIKEQGVKVEELDGTSKMYHMNATVSTKDIAPCDLVLLFTKTGDSITALETHPQIIGPDTILMSLQNGMGHENVLRKFVPEERIIIGTTKEGSYRKNPTNICHSGKGNTAFGAIAGDVKRFEKVVETFNTCGFPCEIVSEIKKMIWDKLMINASSSVLSGIFQIPQGQVATNEHIWNIAKKLITEICETATADGYEFDAKEQMDRVYKHLLAAPDGYTSIYADLKAKKKTEVSVINGAVVEAAHRLGVSVPTHEIIVEMVHGLETCIK
jgi:2-dehydropantoate 2-reductase